MKTKRYWLWIGLVCAIISVPIYLLSEGADGRLADFISYFYLPTIAFVLSGPGMIIGGRPIVGQIIVVLLNGFLNGAIIGWIYGKIKSRKQLGTTTN